MSSMPSGTYLNEVLKLKNNNIFCYVSMYIIMFLHLLSVGVAEVSAVVTFGKWRTLNRLLILQSHVLRYVIQNVQCVSL